MILPPLVPISFSGECDFRRACCISSSLSLSMTANSLLAVPLLSGCMIAVAAVAAVVVPSGIDSTG